MHRNHVVRPHNFAMVPRNDIPRSQFKINKVRHLTTFDAGYLVPHFVEEVYPGDTWNLRHTLYARVSTPIYPIMDNLYMDTFYYFVPLRLLWTNFKKMMGEQANPADSISYTTPQQVSPAGGYAVGSLQDYMGLPSTPMLGANTKSHSAFYTRAYNFIWNECFRDENLQNSITVDLGDGPDATPSTNYILRRRGKRFDYFTSALPWPQKGSSGVSIPLSGTAPITGIGALNGGGTNAGVTAWEQGAAAGTVYPFSWQGNDIVLKGQAAGAPGAANTPQIFANLSSATGVLINQLRQSIMIQEFLESDARGGTRYVESLLMHWGVVSPDFRQQRPEYLGGGSKMININPISQVSATGLTGGSTPLGTQSAFGIGVDRNGFTYSSTEHGVIIGLISVRAELTYQQGLRRMFTRATRYDYYDPAFAHLGNQSIRNDEIYCDGSANDSLTFGYKEAWDELRYIPSRTSSLFKSTAAGTIDPWHLALKFASLPALNDAFIQDAPPVSRVVAVGAAANGQQFIGDFQFDITVARQLPMFSVPHISGIRI
ncbi:MAG: major capsid protein [Arizlama microvirus]|nr:MAG: major capsid protein [Arizlama microvirus]